jgi:hypothetical protein
MLASANSGSKGSGQRTRHQLGLDARSFPVSLPFDVELHAGLVARDLHAGAATAGGRSERERELRFLACLDGDGACRGDLEAVGQDLDLVGARGDGIDRARRGVAPLLAVDEDLDAVDRLDAPHKVQRFRNRLFLGDDGSDRDCGRRALL